jgi:uncharacterized protein YciI
MLLLVLSGGWQEPQVKLATYQLVLLKKGPQFEAMQQKPYGDHLAYMKKLGADGRSMAAGPFTDDGEILGVIVLKAASPEQAREIEAADPAVQAGRFVMEILPFMAAADAFKPWAEPFAQEIVYFGFLNSGPNRGQDAQTAAELQKQHLAYMTEQHEKGALVMAGPFTADGPRRGIVVYRAANLAEAQARASGDPMLKIGRLTLEMHPWSVPKGALQ